MFIFSNLINAIAIVLGMVLNLFLLLVVGRAILSWVSPDPRNPIVRFLYSATEPLLYEVRKRMPFVAAGLDLSPIIVIFGIYFLDAFLVESLRQLAAEIR